MNEKIIFVRTSSGEDEVRSRTAHLSKDIKRALLMVDGTASVAEIIRRASPSLRGMLEDMFVELAKGGFIQDKAKGASLSKLITPNIPVVSPEKPAKEEDELDFTAAYRAPTPAILAEEAAKAQAAARAAEAAMSEERARLEADADAEARARVEAEHRAGETAARKAEQRAAEVRVEVEAKAGEEKARLEAEVAKLKAQAEVEAQSRAVAEAQARLEADAARLKTQQELERLAREAARVSAVQEAARADAEARARVEAERHAQETAEAVRKAERHAARIKAEVEEKARAVGEEKARLEAEVVKLKAHAEAEARLRAAAEERAKLDAARIQAKLAADAERLKAEREAIEAQTRAEAAKARLEAEAARAQAERLAREAQEARVKAEQDAVKMRAETEARVREEAERHARVELEAVRRAEQHAVEVRAEAEARARVVAQEKAKLEAEVAKLRAQAEADAGARAEAAEQAKRETERLAQEAEVARAKAEQEAERAREEVERVREHAAAEARAREEAERVARQAEAARVQAEQEAARIKAEAEARARAEAKAAEVQQQAEASRRKIEQAAANVRNAVERAKQAAEARAHDEAAHRAAEADAALKAEQEAANQNVAQAARRGESEARTNAEMLVSIVRLNTRHAAMEESVFSALDELAQQEAAASGEATQRDETPQDVPHGDSAVGVTSVSVTERRTTIAAVVFFDMVGYSAQPNSQQLELKKQLNQLVTNSISLRGVSERVILDTGDGIAIGFLQHPTDALEAAMHFRNGLMANKHCDYPDLRVRIGIHLGPVSLVKDMNGQINMLGDGINSAQRVMSLASKNQIYVSRAYFDFVASLSDEYGDLFRYRGSQQDKHGREFQVYELLDAEVPADESVQMQDSPLEPASNLADFDFDAFDVVLSQPSEQEASRPQAAEPQSAAFQQMDVAGQLLRDAIGLGQMEAPVAESPVSHAADQADAGRAVEESPHAATQEREYSEAEARQLAGVQAKKWQEAEQRAVELAEKNAESATRKVFQPSVGAEPYGKARSRRKPVAWGKLGAGLFTLVLAALFVVPAVLPTQGYLAGMEQLLSAKLQQPVHIGHLAGRILPTPRLVLSDVSVGGTKQIQSRQVQVNFAFSALFGAVKSINALELEGAQVNGAALPLVAGWLQQVAGDRQYPVARIVLTQGQLEADGIKFSDVDGEIDFDPAGKFAQAKLNAGGHKLALEMRATPEQTLHISLALRDSALPLLPGWLFEELKATGELTRDELRITDLDSRIRGGVLTGEARINWRSGWRVQGALVAKVIPLQNLSKLLVGDMDGSARFQMQAENLAGLTEAAVLNGVFTARKGVISGMDIVETARLRSRENLPGGRTHFDELTGELAYANESYQFRQLKMNDSMVKASGSLTIARQQLTGNISANLAMRAGMGAVALQVGGTTESPTLRAVH